MKPHIQVWDKDDALVVHVRQQFGPDEQLTVLVLDERSAVALCGQIGEALARRTARRSEKPVEKGERWYRVSARAGDNPRTAYVLARSREDAHTRSPLARLHAAEVRVECMADDFTPPNGRSK